MGVALCRRHPRMAEYLLHDADMDALLDQQSGRRVADVMHPRVPDLSPAKDRLPRPPVLGTFDRAAITGGEHQIVVRPRAARPQPLGRLLLPVLA